MKKSIIAPKPEKQDKQEIIVSNYPLYNLIEYPEFLFHFL